MDSFAVTDKDTAIKTRECVDIMIYMQFGDILKLSCWGHCFRCIRIETKEKQISATTTSNSETHGVQRTQTHKFIAFIKVTCTHIARTSVRSNTLTRYGFLNIFYVLFVAYDFPKWKEVEQKKKKTTATTTKKKNIKWLKWTYMIISNNQWNKLHCDSFVYVCLSVEFQRLKNKTQHTYDNRNCMVRRRRPVHDLKPMVPNEFQ